MPRPRSGRRALAAAVTGAWLLVACTPEPDAPPVAPVVQVVAQDVRSSTVRQRLVAYGMVVTDPVAARAITLPFEGRVAAVAAHVGAPVRAGDPLLTVEPSAATREELQRRGREATAAEEEAARQVHLRGDGLATNGDVAAAALLAANARASAAALQEQTGGGRIVVRALSPGIVEALPFLPGDLVASGSLVARVGSSRVLQAQVGIEAADLASLRVGQAVAVTPLGRSPAPPLEGRIVRIDARVDPVSHAAAAQVALPDGAAVSGESVRAEIILAEHAGVPAVPRAALVSPGGPDAAGEVFVVVGGTAHARAVRTGLSDGDVVEIVEGLHASERVATLGVAELSDGIAVAEAPPGAAGGAGPSSP